MTDQILCSKLGCKESSRTRGLCGQHYCKSLRDGEIVKLAKKSIKEMFFSKVNKNTSDECWNWLGAKSGSGYGNFSKTLSSKNRVQIPPHRFSWELFNNKKIPLKLLVCHTCDNRLCVNPKHLFLGSQLDNMRDKMNKGRANMRKGEECTQSKLSEVKANEIRKLASLGMRREDIGNIYGVARQTVNAVVNLRTWKNI